MVLCCCLSSLGNPWVTRTGVLVVPELEVR
jgi:hypothetical protein